MVLGLVIARVLDNPLSHAARKIQSAMCRIALLEVFHDAQRMKVMIKAQSMPLEATIQGSFTRMSKRRMPNVMTQRQCLRKVFVQPQPGCCSSCNFRYFDGVGQSAAKMIGGSTRKDLGLSCQPSKRSR